MKRKTHFDQVPLEVVKKILKEEAYQEEPKSEKAPRNPKKKSLEVGLMKREPLLTTSSNAAGGDL